VDVELQILKHLKRDARPTVSIIDRYCDPYKDLFYDVRSYECFKYLHQGIISSIKRKSLPEIAKVVGINSSQSLHHFLANSPWSTTKLKERRLTQTREALKNQKITVITGSGCPLSKRLELISGVNLSELLATKNQKSDISEK